jgi:hypothetical protein
VWSDLGRSPPFRPMRALRLQWSRAFVLVCEVALTIKLHSLGHYRATLVSLHTRDWEPMTITLQALSLVEKAEPVQVRFTLRLRDHRSMWIQDGCKVYMDSYVASNGSCLMVTCILFYFKKPPLGDRPGTKLGDRNTPNAHNHWFILFYHAWGPSWIEIHRNCSWSRVNHIWLHTTLEGPWPHYLILEVCWDGLWTLSFGLSLFHGHDSWLVCQMALRLRWRSVSIGQ